MYYYGSWHFCVKWVTWEQRDELRYVLCAYYRTIQVNRSSRTFVVKRMGSQFTTEVFLC